MIVAVEEVQKGVTVGEVTVSGLTFADDFVGISATPEGPQEQLEKTLLRGTIVNRTCGIQKNLTILF